MNEVSPPSKLDPLLQGLQWVCRHHGRAHSALNLTAGLPLQNGLLTPSLVGRAAKRAGLYTRIVRRPVHRIARVLLPCLLILKNNRACVLTAWHDDGYVDIVVPEQGDVQVRISEAELNEQYAGIAIYLRPKFLFDARTPEVLKRKSEHWFWSVIFTSRHLYRDIFLLAFVLNILALAMPLFTMNVYDRVVPNLAFETLWVLALGVILVLGFDYLLRNMRVWVLELANKRIDTKLSAKLMEQILGMRLENKPASVGSFANNVRAFESVRDFIATASVTTFIDLPFGLIFILVLGVIGWPLIIPVVLAMLVIGLHSYWTHRQLSELAEQSYRAGAQRNAILVEALTGLETMRAFNASTMVQTRWEQSTRFLAHLNGRMRQLTQRAYSFVAGFQQLTSVAVLVAGIYLMSEGEMTMGGLIAAMMLSSRCIAPMGQIAALLTQLQNTTTSLKSLDEMMSTPIERPADAQFLSREKFDGGIEFRHVSLRYPNSEQDALNDVSFRLSPGERVGIIGRIGSGKSSIHRLISGLYQPSDGAILIDGIDLRQLDPVELRRAIGYVPQDPGLVFGTLRDNIALGAPHATDAEILSAAFRAGVSDFANRHPAGFSMPVSERGESLSSGQKQSIAIARALLQNPPILLLDEPTSHMDFISEDRLKKQLTQVLPGHTVLLVTHRTTLLDFVDRIIVLDNGKLIADGPKAEVLKALQEGRIKGATV
ncbi:type I secretion system permease/ATPase [Permianibacter aggregans]|uniref:ATP-binding cassette subfamily C protein LapB n=1 Tax=Permianibacter aggregans TaxID=1510150 RepID=A0A4V3D7Y2_9GAMM|nr:type I secretion system permease/ATPase [Permianibacter aggregans]QGX39601.1 type I secretion system permease/ATPase [Permianibacter aggregans]TDQ49647.1 ATP-binding cassette subfamily C protein LapB [Permianibacter aggregans]